MKPACLLLLILLLPCYAAGFEAVEVGGHLKSLNFYLDRIPSSSEEGVISSERARLNVTGSLSQDVDFEAAIEQQLLWSDPPAAAALPRDSQNRLFDLEHSWNRNGRTESQLQVDRLLIGGERGRFSWAAGRQAIGFGRISLFSPLDVIAPFAPEAIDVDVRPGVDAVKLTRYFGLGGQFGGVAVFGDQPRHNSYLLTFSENLGNLDLLLLVGRLRGRPLMGFGLAGELGPVGIKGELSWYRGRQVGAVGGDRKDAFAIAALEGWYRFDNGLVLLAEYLYNGVGVNDLSQYPLVAVSAPLQEGLSFLLGRHYLLLGPSYELHPLVTLNGLLIQNLQDASCLLRPQLAISLSDNLQLDLYWGFALGQKNRRKLFTGQPRTESEFGAVGDSGGVLLRYYF